MSVPCQSVRAGQSGWACPHHGYLFARACGTGKQRRTGLLQVAVGGKTLQRADLYGLVLGGVAHTGLLAQNLGRANPRAHAAQGVGFEDGVRCAAHIAVGDTLDEAGYVDGRGAGSLAGGVETEVAAVGLVFGLKHREWRVRVAKIALVLRGRQAARLDTRR